MKERTKPNVQAMINDFYQKFKDAPEILCDVFSNDLDKPTRTIVKVRKNEEHKLDEVPSRGIYFLMSSHYVCYVGMSCSCIKTRILGNNRFDGHCESKLFSSFKYIDMAGSKDYIISDAECIYINMFQPMYNIMLNNKAYIDYVPKEYEELSKEGFEKLRYFSGIISYNSAIELAEKCNFFKTKQE